MAVCRNSEAGRLVTAVGIALLWVGATALAAADGPRVAQAAKAHDATALAALLKGGADVNQPLPDGATALHWAVYWNDAALAERLLRAGAHVDARNRYGTTPLWMACSEGNAPMVTLLLKSGADAKAAALDGEPVIMTAALSGSVESVEALIAHGADVNAKEVRQGQTALMWAIGARESYPAITRVLLAHGADVKVRSAGGLTPLLFAARQGDLEATRMLIAAGADVNDKAVAPIGPMALFGDGQWSFPSADTSTAMTLAIINGHFEVARALLEHGADPNLSSDAFPYRTRPNISVNGEALKPGLTALHAVMVRRGKRAEPGSLELLKAMVARGGQVNAKTPSVKAPVPTQLNPQPVITWVQAGGVTPFWIAANALDVDAMKLLVELGADPKAKSMEDTTPLMVAAGLGIKSRGPSGGFGRRADWDVEALRLLLDWGNDINAVNIHGQTALHGAAFAAAKPAVQFLKERGARLDLKDSMGRTPLTVAHDNLRVEYRPALQNHTPEDIKATIDYLESLSRQ